MQNKLVVVLNYEFRKIVKTKTFIVMTILGPFLLAAIILIPSLVSMNTVGKTDEKTVVGIFAEQGADLNFVSSIEKAIQEEGLKIEKSFDKEAIHKKTLAKDIIGYLSFSGSDVEYFTTKPGEFGINSIIQNAINDFIVALRLSEKGLDYDEVKNLMQGYELSIKKISEKNEEGVESDEGIEFLFAFLTPMIFSLMIYMSVLLYGQMIGRSVVMEKSSKVVDVLLSSVKPSELMMGKIFGVGLAGILQYGIWILMALAAAFVAQLALGFELPEQLALKNFIYLGVYFILGYVLYGALFAAAGSASEDEQHLGQLSLPIILFLVVPIMLNTSLIENPNSIVSLVLAFFPLSAPLTMLTRIVTGDVPFWQIAVSIASLIVSIAFFIRLSSKIFKTGILMSGKNFKFKEIIRWI